MRPYLQDLKEAKFESESQIKETGEAAKRELLAKAKELRRQGMIREAKALEAEAGEVITDVVLADQSPEVEGLQDKWPWKGVCESPMDLIIAVAEGRQALTVSIEVKGELREVPILIPNEQAINYFARKLQNSMKIAGCKARQDVQFARKA